jgi:hypothetical protein
MPEDLGYHKGLGMLNPGINSFSFPQTWMSKRSNVLTLLRCEIPSYLMEVSLILIDNFSD